MRVLIFSTGSLGDFLPFVGIGRELQQRGHEVTLFGNGFYRRYAEQAALDFQALYSADHYQRSMDRNWSGLSGVRLWVEHTLSLVTPVEQLIRARAVAGETVVISVGWMLGARIAREMLDIRLVTVHLQVEALGTLLAGEGPLQRARRAIRRSVFAAMSDALFARRLNAMRKTLGLSPVRRVVTQWWNSPDLVIGMFPEWFQPPAPDWPDRTFLAGFALYEPDRVFEGEGELQAFLEAGEAPLVFAQGSWVSDAAGYFRTSIDAAQALGRRAILLTSRPGDVPSSLPPGVLHMKFVPYSRLLPYAAAMIHHGGIGSLAAAVQAGIPQLICPRAGDQLPNARRLKRLGLAETIASRHYRTDRVCAALERLLSSPSVAAACAGFSRVSAAVGTFERIADRVEGLFGGGSLVRDKTALLSAQALSSASG
jgi:UDP:flavonoid glycosyltransferase YjiC (YdhE family)